MHWRYQSWYWSAMIFIFISLLVLISLTYLVSVTWLCHLRNRHMASHRKRQLCLGSPQFQLPECDGTLHSSRRHCSRGGILRLLWCDNGESLYATNGKWRHWVSVLLKASCFCFTWTRTTYCIFLIKNTRLRHWKGAVIWQFCITLDYMWFKRALRHLVMSHFYEVRCFY